MNKIVHQLRRVIIELRKRTRYPIVSPKNKLKLAYILGGNFCECGAESWQVWIYDSGIVAYADDICLFCDPITEREVWAADIALKRRKKCAPDLDGNHCDCIACSPKMCSKIPA